MGWMRGAIWATEYDVKTEKNIKVQHADADTSIEEGYVIKRHPACLHAYIITRLGIQKMLDNILPLNDAIDLKIASWIFNGQLNGYVFNGKITYDEKTFDEALVNAELPFDKLVGPTQEVSFIATDNEHDIKMARKEIILHAMMGNTKNMNNSNKLSDKISDQMLHDSLISKEESKKINEENAKARNELDRRRLIYDVFRRWKLLATKEAYVRIKRNKQEHICKYLIEKTINLSTALIRKGFCKWYSVVMASPLSFQTKVVGGKRVLLCDGKIVQIFG
eukprot:g9478.t1